MKTTVAYSVAIGAESMSWLKALFLAGIIGCVVGLKRLDHAPDGRLRSVDEEVIDSSEIPLIIESTEEDEAENVINEEDEDKDITEEGGQIKLF